MLEGVSEGIVTRTILSSVKRSCFLAEARFEQVAVAELSRIAALKRLWFDDLQEEQVV